MIDPEEWAWQTAKVPVQACDGTPLRSGGVRHMLPAGAALRMHGSQAEDYRETPPGVIEPIDVQPFLEAISAVYFGCGPCEERHVSVIANDPVLTTHVIGVALEALGADTATAEAVCNRFGAPGDVIALVLRNYGPRAAVDVAKAADPGSRRQAVIRAVYTVMPVNWLRNAVSAVPGFGQHGRRLGDQEVLDGYRGDYPVPDDRLAGE
ncbi:hypothetical protein [Cryptosporangium phraense]|uniref:Uncharacterized protein n=1 Tax=Cryptosporangium phraense TaxID=2593070 RepID=A0A545AUS9_9ACTN|nr:hypothetical protein [Cryptosporangium phraense]TQS44345.1 hypothetical protein FL583_15545 [Cryptosporangium phraense]